MKRGFWPLRDIPVVGWLTATVLVTVTAPWHSTPRWLMIHLLLLGALTHSIFIWSQFFTDGALKTPLRAVDQRIRATRLMLLNLSVVVVVAGVIVRSWPTIVVGGTGVAVSVTWHGLSIGSQVRRSNGRRFVATARYYVCAAALLPVGIGLGVALSRGLSDAAGDRVWLAHVAINVLGWIGLTIVGTLMTFWPTMLRTQIVEHAERATGSALPVFLVSIVIVAGSFLAGQRLLAAVGVLGYLIALTMIGKPFVMTAVKRHPKPLASWSMLAAMTWFYAWLIGLLVVLVITPSMGHITDRLSHLLPFLVLGTAAQILLGALTYLVPVSLGGGPSAARAAGNELERYGAFRFTIVNGGLLVCALPVSDRVRDFNGALVVAGLAVFIPLMVRAVLASRSAAKRSREAIAAGRRQTRTAPAEVDTNRIAAMIVAGLILVILAIVGGVAADAGNHVSANDSQQTREMGSPLSFLHNSM